MPLLDKDTIATIPNEVWNAILARHKALKMLTKDHKFLYFDCDCPKIVMEHYSLLKKSASHPDEQ